MGKRRLLGAFLALAMILTITVFTQDKVTAAGTDRVLLIQGDLPWGSTANTDVLAQLQTMGDIAAYDVHTFSEVNAEDFDLSVYKIVLVANDQSQASYDQYGAVTKAKLEDFALAGGVVIFGACDGGWSGGTLSATLPGGITKTASYQSNNYIVDAGSPFVTGELSNHTALTDADLYGTSCSHVTFNEGSLPAGTNVILRGSDDHLPTLVDYPMGFGHIIASGLTWEFSYSRGFPFATKAYDDLLLYALDVAAELAEQDAPVGLAGSAVSFSGESDGKITGTTSDMEYKLIGDSTYSSASDTETTGLAAGTYYVRYAAKAGFKASPYVMVTVADGPARTYTLAVTAPAFPDLALGNPQPDAKAITITSSGNSDATISGVTVSGSDFTIAGSGAAVPAGGSIDTWTIRPDADLAIGAYTATITVTYDGGAQATADVQISVVARVDAASPVYTTNIGGTQTFVMGAAVSPLTVKAESTDGGAITYQWYMKSGENGVPAAISGATAGSYTPKTDVAGVFYYYAVATNTNSAANGNQTAQLGSGVYKMVVNAPLPKTGETTSAAPYAVLAAGAVCAAALIVRKRRAGNL